MVLGFRVPFLRNPHEGLLCNFGLHIGATRLCKPVDLKNRKSPKLTVAVAHSEASDIPLGLRL